MGIDMVGRRFNNWVVIEQKGVNKCKQKMWLCRCDCGTVRAVNGSSLRMGRSKSCGCLFKGTHNFKHGMRNTRFYEIWASMVNRCYGKNQTSYKHYGGRGIQVCERWKDFSLFKEDLLEEYEEHVRNHGEANTTLDRRDGNEDYKPSNVRWATWSVQNLNK